MQIVLQSEPQGDRRPELSPQPHERARLQEDRAGLAAWKFWGPYLSERQWGTVREDYSPHGNAWDDFSHDQARSRAYRWGEDGIGGISDEQQRLCLALALWNGQDPILKERLFGLTNGEGNHSEDVKELYYYLDATPTHSYLKYLYKYPQAEFPYASLVEENRRRGKDQPVYCMGCHPELGGGPVGAVDRERPAEPIGLDPDLGAMARHPGFVLLAPGLGAAGRDGAGAFRLEELDAAGIREGLLGRIDDLFGVPATTRSWTTIAAIVRILKDQDSERS